MTAEEFYEEQRQIRNTVDITENPDPDYTLPFYQGIFWLMEEYAQHSTRERHDETIKFLERKIEGCNELGDMVSERWAFQQCLKWVRSKES